MAVKRKFLKLYAAEYGIKTHWWQWNKTIRENILMAIRIPTITGIEKSIIDLLDLNAPKDRVRIQRGIKKLIFEIEEPCNPFTRLWFKSRIAWCHVPCGIDIEFKKLPWWACWFKKHYFYGEL